LLPENTCTLARRPTTAIRLTLRIRGHPGRYSARRGAVSKSNRLLVGLGIAAVVGAYVWTFGPQTMLTLIARYEYRRIPAAENIPVALSDLSVSSVPHKTVAYFGYEFELPWDDVDEQKSRTAETVHVHITAFHSGNAFWFSTFPARDFVKNIVGKTKLTPEQFRQIYGNEAFESDLGFMRTMLQITPRGMSPFMPKRQAAASSTLLLIKAISVPEAESGIFLIRTADFQGFQLGNPQSRPSRVREDLYAGDGGIEVIFFQGRGTSPSVSQGDINRILQSVRKTSSPSVASNPNLNR
jgi:hypothetical protein